MIKIKYKSYKTIISKKELYTLLKDSNLYWFESKMGNTLDIFVIGESFNISLEGRIL